MKRITCNKCGIKFKEDHISKDLKDERCPVCRNTFIIPPDVKTEVEIICSDGFSEDCKFRDKAGHCKLKSHCDYKKFVGV